MPAEVFIAYSHTDELMKEELVKHLSPLKRSGEIEEWHDCRIEPGADWTREIDRHLNNSRIVLLLISADFIDSDYCYGVETKRAMERHERNETRVIPIVLRPCDWHELPFAKLRALPKDGRAVTLWSSQDEAYTDIVLGIRAALRGPVASVSRQTVVPLPTQQYYSTKPFDSLEHQLWVARCSDEKRYMNPVQYRKHGVRSETVLRVMLVPEQPLSLTIDRRVEAKFQNSVEEYYPIVHDTVAMGAAYTDELHGQDWYTVEFIEPLRHHHMMWHTNGTGEIGFATQTLFDVAPVGMQWSLTDTVMFVLATVRAAHAYWAERGYLGAGLLRITLDIGTTAVAKSGNSFASLISNGIPDLVIPDLRMITAKRPSAAAEARFTDRERTTALLGAMTQITNAILRDLGFSLDTTTLEHRLAPLLQLVHPRG